MKKEQDKKTIKSRVSGASGAGERRGGKDQGKGFCFVLQIFSDFLKLNICVTFRVHYFNNLWKFLANISEYLLTFSVIFPSGTPIRHSWILLIS